MNKKYKNPPIIEAVCEFRFVLDNPLEQKFVNLIYNDIKEKFSKQKKGEIHEMKFALSTKEKEGKREFIENVREFEQFFSNDEKSLVRLDKERLSIHKLRPYTSWDEFISLIRLVFDSYIKNVRPKSIQRIGLRYINNFEIPLPSFDIEQYFNLRPVIGKDLPKNLTSFFVGTIFIFENGRDNAKVQLMDKPLSNNKSPFVLDIDYFLAQPNAISIAEVEKWLSTAHQNVENIFEISITEKVKGLFN